MALLAASLAVGAFAGPGSAGRRKVRKARAVYESPAIGAGDATGTCVGANGCVTFGVGPKETSLSLEIEDSLGLPVYATVGQDLNPDDQFYDVLGKICGKTEKPFVIEPGIPINIWLWPLPGLNPPCAGAASSGTVTATFGS